MVARMLTDLVGFYAEMNEPGYREMCEAMFRSAENFAVRRVHLADEKTEFLNGAFDRIRCFHGTATNDNLITLKALAFARYGLQAERNAVYTDMDVLWLKDPAPLFDADFDVAVIKRKAPPYPIMPYNGGLMLAKPTPGARLFWKTYHSLVTNSPECIKGWWVEQIVMATLLGINRRIGETVEYEGAKILVMDAHKTCRVPKGDDKGEGAYALHFKGYAGAKKWMMELAA